MEEKAKEIKEEGNKLYKVGKLDEALTCYRKASALQPKDPVYQSNISAVLYEIGRYDDCIQSITQALSLLSSSSPSNPVLEAKLLLRKTKASFYGNKYKEAKETIEKLDELVMKNKITHPDADSEITRGAIERALKFSPHQGRAMPFRICRYPLETNTLEYVVTGHETPVSIFSGYLSETQQKELDDFEATNLQDRFKKFEQLHAKAQGRINLSPPAYNSYSFFFGSVGDARHVLASLNDIAHSFKPQRQLTNFHFTLVDVKAVSVARGLVLFYLLRHLATFPVKNLSKNINAIEIIALLQYMGLGCSVLPSYLYARMIVTLREIRRDLTNRSLPPFISVHSAAIPELIHIIDGWIDFKISTEEMYNRTVGIQPPEREGESQRQRLEKMTDQDLAKFKIQGLTTLHEIRDALRLSVEFLEFDDAEQYLLGTSTEYTLYGHAKVLSPPHPLLKKHPVFQQFYKMNTNIRERRFAAGDTTFSFQHVIKDVIDNWRPNVTLWDQPWVQLNDKVGGLKFSHNVFFEAANLFLPMAHPANPCSMFDYAFEFFTPVAAAIAKMETSNYKFKLEWIVGETYSVAFDISHSSEKAARDEKKLPTSFDRIHLSDVPDNTGGNLSIATFIMPMLKQLSHSSVTYSIHNNHLFESFEEWLKSNSLLTREASQNILGMKYLNGNLYEPLVWAPNTPAVAKLATQDDLTLWLYRVFLFIVLPPHSESHPVAGRIDYPLNLVAFVHLLVRLIGIGYPTHWIGLVLDNLLSGKIKTKARPPPDSLKQNVPLITISTKPFLADLEAAILSNEQYLPFKLFSSHLPFPLHKIILDVQVKMGNDMSAPVFALLFGKLDDLMAMKPNDLRYSLLNNNNIEEEPKIMVYSNVRWISAIKEVEVWIPENRLEKMMQNDWFFAAIRVDLWIPLTMPQPIKPK